MVVVVAELRYAEIKLHFKNVGIQKKSSNLFIESFQAKKKRIHARNFTIL